MARINIVTAESANPEQQGIYDAIHAQLGMVPNFLKVFANSPAAASSASSASSRMRRASSR